MKIFEGDNASEVWLLAANYLMENKNIKEVGSRVGNTLEKQRCSFVIQDSRSRWIVHRAPMISPAFAIAEIFWILSGRNDAKFINTWNPKLPDYAGHGETYHGAYGHRLRKNYTFDQLQRAYQTLLHNNQSRQVVLQIWDPTLDLPEVEGKPNAEDIPCNISSMLKIRDGKLEWTQVMRSNDLFRGTPYNFIQFTTLHEIISGWLDIEVGSFYLFVDSLHVYTKDIENMGIEETFIATKNTDSLQLSKEKFDLVLSLAMKLLEDIATDGVTEKNIEDLKNNYEIPQSYKNLLAIPFSYLAYKENNQTLLAKCEDLCDNIMLLGIWESWKLSRKNS